ncbi:MAG: hypothetical protein M5U14_05330 [Acidimicrobiia bacterium]|nr:hypothetical protein [Acidimicrobiia bacterium]
MAIGRTGSRIVVEVDDTRTVEVAPGITYQERFQGTIGVDLCPDAEGVVEVTVDVRGEGTATVDGVAVSSQVTVSGTVTARVDESAQVADTTFDLTTGYASQGGVDASGKPPPSSFTEVHTTATVASGGSTEGDATVVRSSSQADPSRAMQVTQSAIDVVAELVRQALGKAESVWQNGGCVSLEVLEAPGRVEPGSEHPVNAEVHHVFEGKDLDLPVRATLGAGGESVSPGEARGVPARFTYVAPSEDGARATLVLETRSRRGADRETIEIEVGGGWRAEGGGDGITITGTIGDLAAPFQLQGQFEGGSATLSYSPAGEEGGTFTYQGGGSGVTVSGSGTYTVTENPDGTRTISGTADGCVKGISGSCRTTHNVITLYPE